MTVASQLKQTLTSLKGAAATLRQYEQYHPDHRAQQVFAECRDRLEKMSAQMERRIQQIEYEEPQFRGV